MSVFKVQVLVLFRVGQLTMRKLLLSHKPAGHCQDTDDDGSVWAGPGLLARRQGYLGTGRPAAVYVWRNGARDLADALHRNLPAHVRSGYSLARASSAECICYRQSAGVRFGARRQRRFLYSSRVSVAFGLLGYDEQQTENEVF